MVVGATGTIFSDIGFPTILFSRDSLLLAPLLRFRCDLDSGTRKLLPHATVKVACESEQRRERTVVPGLDAGRQRRTRVVKMIGRALRTPSSWHAFQVRPVAALLPSRTHLRASAEHGLGCHLLDAGFCSRGDQVAAGSALRPAAALAACWRVGAGPRACCCSRERRQLRRRSERQPDFRFDRVGAHQLEAANPSVVGGRLCAAAMASVNTWTSYPCVLGELRTEWGGACDGVAGAKSAERRSMECCRLVVIPRKKPQPENECCMRVRGRLDVFEVP